MVPFKRARANPFAILCMTSMGGESLPHSKEGKVIENFNSNNSIDIKETMKDIKTEIVAREKRICDELKNIKTEIVKHMEAVNLKWIWNQVIFGGWLFFTVVGVISVSGVSFRLWQ